VTKILHPLFSQVAKCISSPHFQIAERALFLWNNDAVTKYTNDHREKIVPILYPALNANTQKHWNPTVHSLAFNVTRMFMEMDVALWDKVSQKHVEQQKLEKQKKLIRASKWDKLKKSAEIRRRKMETPVSSQK